MQNSGDGAYAAVEAASGVTAAADYAAGRRRFDALQALDGDAMVLALFEQFAGGDDSLGQAAYGRFLTAIGYSKHWTDAQWAKECAAVGAAAETGVTIEGLRTLYRSFRPRKLRSDYARTLNLPADLFEQVLRDRRPAVLSRADSSRGPGGPTGPLRTPSRTPWILCR
jgi:hypothetical protein